MGAYPTPSAGGAAGGGGGPWEDQFQADGICAAIGPVATAEGCGQQGGAVAVGRVAAVAVGRVGGARGGSGTPGGKTGAGGIMGARGRPGTITGAGYFGAGGGPFGVSAQLAGRSDTCVGKNTRASASREDAMLPND